MDGEHALVGGAAAIFRTDGTGWQRVEAPAGSTPARALVSGAARGRVYLAGRTGFYRSDDWGQSWIDVGSEFQAERTSAWLVPPGRPDQIYVVAGGRVWVSADAARSWQLSSDGLPSGSMEAVGVDPADPNRLWAVGVGQVFRTDDQGQRWRPVGQPLPERPAVARAVAVSGRVILIATDRGVYRSPDDGERWELPSDGLPAHVEAGLLALDPGSPTTRYAGFALMPYDELSRRAVEGGRAVRSTGPDQSRWRSGVSGPAVSGSECGRAASGAHLLSDPVRPVRGFNGQPNSSIGPRGAVNQATEGQTAPRRSRRRWLATDDRGGDRRLRGRRPRLAYRAVGGAGVPGVQAAAPGGHPGQHRRGA